MRLTCPMCGYENEMKGTHPPSMPFIYTCPKCGQVAKKMTHETGGSKYPSNLLWLYLVLGVGLVLVMFLVWNLSPNKDVATQHLVGYNLTPSVWSGERTLRGEKNSFDLIIESIDDDSFNGILSWTDRSPALHRSVTGTHDGNHLVFWDYEYQRVLKDLSELGEVVLIYKKKDVYIMGNSMVGTDMNGDGRLKAEERK